MNDQLKQLNDLVQGESQFIEAVLNETQKVIVGQHYVIERLLMGVLVGGHVLLEGVPGLAKTLSINTLAKVFNVGFKRIQFTPDLLPADLLGTMIYNQATQEFIPKKGPIFSNFILADEINRAPAKVQSALLEAMQERQVTIGDMSYSLEEPFLVLATQNPVDQEGTYSLPEAQVDRFIIKIKVDYPKKEDERVIIDRMVSNQKASVQSIAKGEDILRARNIVQKIYVDDKIKEYVLDIIFATRFPDRYNMGDLTPLITYGASPRASIALVSMAKAHAFLKRRGFVTPEDIKAVGRDVLRHRVIPSFEAEAEEMSSESIVDRIFSEIEVP